MPEPRRRWPRRLLIGSASAIALVVVIVAGVFGYAEWRLGDFHHFAVAHLVAPTGSARDVLVVTTDTPGYALVGGRGAPGATTEAIVVARFDPASRTVRLLSVAPATWLVLGGASSPATGPNRVAAALAGGDGPLVETLAHSLHLEVNDVIELDAPALGSIVDALGGVSLELADPLRDAFAGVDLSRAGCVTVSGAQAVALERSENLYYFESGAWHYDPSGALGRAERQALLYEAVLARIGAVELNPLALNRFAGAAAAGLRLSTGLGSSTLVSMLRDLHSTGRSRMGAAALPGTPSPHAGGEVVMPSAAADAAAESAFRSGASSIVKGSGPPVSPWDPSPC